MISRSPNGTDAGAPVTGGGAGMATGGGGEASGFKAPGAEPSGFTTVGLGMFTEGIGMVFGAITG